MSNFQARIGNGAEFADLLAALLPGASSRAQVKFFGARADYRKIVEWKRGDRWPADWAIARVQAAVADRVAFLQTKAARVQSGPGRKGHRATLKQFRQAA